MKYYLILSLVTNLSVCDICGTVTQPPRYKYDIFNEDSEKISSFTPPTTRIFGGRQVEIGEVPWQANLLYPSNF